MNIKSNKIVAPSHLDKVGEFRLDQSVELISAQRVGGTVSPSVRLEFGHQRTDSRLHHKKGGTSSRPSDKNTWIVTTMEFVVNL